MTYAAVMWAHRIPNVYIYIRLPSICLVFEARFLCSFFANCFLPSRLFSSFLFVLLLFILRAYFLSFSRLSRGGTRTNIKTHKQPNTKLVVPCVRSLQHARSTVYFSFHASECRHGPCDSLRAFLCNLHSSLKGWHAPSFSRLPNSQKSRVILFYSHNRYLK